MEKLLLSKSAVDAITYKVVGAAIEVHKKLGPGLLESVYQKCLAYELNQRDIGFAVNLKTPIVYKGVSIDTDLRCDILVEDCLVIEIKSVEGLLPIHIAQCLTYMKMLQVPKGILMNFNVCNIFHEGQRTLVNDLYAQLSP
jgi:GxxExxY protein